MADVGGDFYLCILYGYILSSKLSDESDHFIPDKCVLEVLRKMDGDSYDGSGSFRFRS